MFQSAKTLTQVAALPFVELQAGVEILLITSRRRGRWILPRGWPAEGVAFARAAAREAEQEAGVIGEVGEPALGDYIYKKRTGRGYRVPCRVFVYPLLVTEHVLDWREKGQRDQRWCDVATAAASVKQKGLAAFLGDLSRAPDLGARLNALIEHSHPKAN